MVELYAWRWPTDSLHQFWSDLQLPTQLCFKECSKSWWKLHTKCKNGDKLFFKEQHMQAALILIFILIVNVDLMSHLFQEGMQEALQIIIYCLLAVFTVMLLAGCAKCCFRGLCPRRFTRNYDRRPSDVSLTSFFHA